MTTPATYTSDDGLVASTPGTVVPDGVDVLAADGAIIRIRPVRLADASGLVNLHERASDAALYRRFLSPGHHQIGGEVKRLVRPPDVTFAALVALERGRIIGVSSYEVLADATRAEFAIFVDDANHDRGIGTLLLEHLAVRARRHGIIHLEGDVLPTNSPMLRVAKTLGQPIRSKFDLGVVKVHLDTADSGTDAIDLRDFGAARHSLSALLTPGCVAVVGAESHPGSLGRSVLEAIVNGEFTGTVYAVNPHASTVAGVVSYPSVTAGPQRPDLVIITVPAPAVAQALAGAAAAGARAAVIMSAGAEDSVDQRDLVRSARAAGMRLVGPDSLGVLNTDAAIRLHATFGAAPKPGGLALASQSGSVGISLLKQAATAGLGISTFVSLGNKTDVSGNDLLSYWYDDRAAEAVALYLESLGNPRRFARIARAVARRKPVLVVKSGRTAPGTPVDPTPAAAVAPDLTVEELFAQAGIIRCDGLRDLIGTARMLVNQPRPAGNRIAIIGNAGGVNTICADAAEAAELTLPILPADVQVAIRAAAPACTTTANPVDLGTGANVAALRTTIRAVAPHADVIVVAVAATSVADVAPMIEGIGAAVDDIELPVAVILFGADQVPTHVGHRQAPVYEQPEEAITALGRATWYAQWQRTPLGQRPDLGPIDAAKARRLVAAALAAAGGWQPAHIAGDLLACYGIAACDTRTVSTPQGAVDAAMFIQYPVVLKSADPTLIHKSDIGGVRLNLADAAGVEAAYRAVKAATGSEHVLVQPQAPAGVELVAGIVHDALFGSVVTCGLGGIHSDLLRDRTLRLPPVTDRDAAQMWRDLRAAPLLTGYRGSAPVDTAAVEDLLIRLGRLAEDLPEIAELDLNSIIVGTRGCTVVDVKLRLAGTGAEPDPAMRSLREPA
jgi:acyl-CoA synthetase (NDP forming)/GNAT superfamily N-acetyltransferase